MNDTTRTIQRVAQQAEERHASDVEKVAACTAAAPTYLQGRVEREETLPRVVVGGDEETMSGGVLRFLVPSDMPADEGGLPHTLSLEAMDFLTPIWHPARADVEPPELPPRVVSPPDWDALEEVFANIDLMPDPFCDVGVRA